MRWDNNEEGNSKEDKNKIEKVTKLGFVTRSLQY